MKPERSSRWKPYVPDANAPWNLARVVHLHRRAGLGATWEELQRDLADGPEAAVERLIEGRSRIAPKRDDDRVGGDQLARAAVMSDDITRLEASWIFRMLHGSDPFCERIALMWHDHFATSQLKVNDVRLMHDQNRLLREHALSPFEKLLAGMVRDPALLVWLDAGTNHRRHPNENLARELLELFALGVGNYTETDVKEAARALTGWTVRDGEAAFVPIRHDPGEKTVLGQRGSFDESGLLEVLLSAPATPQHVAARLCGQLMGEGVIDTTARTELADRLHSTGLDVGDAAAMIVRSRGFFEAANLRSRVTEPIPWAVGAVRALEQLSRTFSTVGLAEWASRIGQRLFFPPNVGGWPTGRSWLATRYVIGRVNFVSALVDGRLGSEPEPIDALGLAQRHGRAESLSQVVTFFGELLLGDGESAVVRRVDAALRPSKLDESIARRALGLLLASPEAQLA